MLKIDTSTCINFIFSSFFFRYLFRCRRKFVLQKKKNENHAPRTQTINCPPVCRRVFMMVFFDKQISWFCQKHRENIYLKQTLFGYLGGKSRKKRYFLFGCRRFENIGRLYSSCFVSGFLVVFVLTGGMAFSCFDLKTGVFSAPCVRYDV